MSDDPLRRTAEEIVNAAKNPPLPPPPPKTYTVYPEALEHHKVDIGLIGGICFFVGLAVAWLLDGSYILTVAALGIGAALALWYFIHVIRRPHIGWPNK